MDFKFSEICKLLESIETCRQRPGQGSLDLIRDWCARHRARLLTAPGHEAIAVLSCLFPELRPDRVYGLVPKHFVKAVTTALAITGTSREQRLLDRLEKREELGAAVAGIVVLAEHDVRDLNGVTALEVEALFMSLASVCRFSSSDVYLRPQYGNGPARPRTCDLLRPVLARLRSFEIKWLIRMLEKDIRPAVLPLHACLGALHFALPAVYSFHSDIRVAVRALFRDPLRDLLTVPAPAPTQLPEYAAGVLERLTPVLGVPVRTPKSYKARKLKDVQAVLEHGEAWAEIKYDGERMQIHVSLCPPFIKIFSKSGRDSSEDRAGVHESIRQALRVTDAAARGFKHSVILEAELVVFDTLTARIAEFHRISDHVTRAGTRINPPCSEDRGHERLMAVFFDVLMVDSRSLLMRSYDYRRSCLESLVQETPGRSLLARRERLDLSDLHMLENAFAVAVSSGEEGIVVKRAGSTYVGASMDQAGHQWVKVKKDYIQGLGDTADFAIIGAGLEPKRAKERNRMSALMWSRSDSAVGAGVLTTFFVGCLTNKEAVGRFAARPSFDAVFTVSYGLDKQKLARIRDLLLFASKTYDQEAGAEEYDITFHRHTRCPMQVYFPKPLVFEILCAGFDKPAGNSFYVMRWPRVVKLHFDRDWRDSTSMDELQAMAEMAARARLERTESSSRVPIEEVHRNCTTASGDFHVALPDGRQGHDELDGLRELMCLSRCLCSKALGDRRNLWSVVRTFTRLPGVAKTELGQEYGGLELANSIGASSTLVILLVESRRVRTTRAEIAMARRWISDQFDCVGCETSTVFDMSSIARQARDRAASLVVLDWRALSQRSGPDLSAYFILREVYARELV